MSPDAGQDLDAQFAKQDTVQDEFYRRLNEDFDSILRRIDAGITAERLAMDRLLRRLSMA